MAANLTVNLANGELFADDSMAEQVSEFASGTLAMETDDMLDSVAAVVYGATAEAEGGELKYNAADTPPLGGLAYYKRLKRSGKTCFKGYYYPKVRAALGNDNAQTKGSSCLLYTSPQWE